MSDVLMDQVNYIKSLVVITQTLICSFFRQRSDKWSLVLFYMMLKKGWSLFREVSL